MCKLKIDKITYLMSFILKESWNVCNVIFRNIWNFVILEKQNFPENLKLADITLAYKKKDPTFIEN